MLWPLQSRSSINQQFSRRITFAKRGLLVLICLPFRGQWGGGGVGWGAGPALPACWVVRGGAQRLLKSSFFLLQSICGARLLLRFWWALSLATAREMLKSGMGSEEEVDEGAAESCFLGLSWEFS